MVSARAHRRGEVCQANAARLANTAPPIQTSSLTWLSTSFLVRSVVDTDGTVVIGADGSDWAARLVDGATDVVVTWS